MGETSHRSLIKGSRAASSFRRKYSHRILLPENSFKIKHTKTKYIF